MKTILLFTASICLASIHCLSQSNVRAWYADGQVFVVWKINLPIEATYAIYASPAPFTNTANAVLVGRPFALEYLGFGLKDNLADSTATFNIPDGQGANYQLAINEGLFVFTPHQAGSLYFAVTKWGDSTVTPGQNSTATAVPFLYDPAGDPVECHLQRIFPSPFAPGFTCFAYCMWADGRQNHWEGRPDFPIMANAAKNGMPGLFLVSAPNNLDTTQAFPLSVWLHGGGGIARQSLAGSRREVNINPAKGILVAHDDKMYGYRGATPPHTDQPTWHFGWAKNYDPFTPNVLLTADTVVNYTQRRYLWVDNWLAKNFNIDANRINIHGHSMGSAGALGLAKAYPQHYGSATIFNTGCAGPEDNANTIYVFGFKTDNFPTNLKNRKNEFVRFLDLWDLYTNCSPARDLPLIKHWHGKQDDNGTMRWSPIVIENFRICDSIGTGIQNYWSERPHGMDMAPAFNDHWIQDIPPAQQTASDNVSFAEARYRSDASFPAFFNHRLDTKNNDPGTGLIGINNGDGDNWGAWGGYHRWENVTETPQAWQATVWLESNAVFPNDNCPEDFLTADLAIRRPQVFLPATGQMISWKAEDLTTGNILQNGVAQVQADNLTVIPQVAIFKESIRKVRITVINGIIPTAEAATADALLRIFPNPTAGAIFMEKDWRSARILDLNGVEVKCLTELPLEQVLDVSILPDGLYFLEILTAGRERKVGKFVKM
ncbi:MAG: hypothetical protein JNK89_01460 [Saprospiraceae bacterium]|nr:hypothetical protein [Saprospiraceae bacterium]